MDTMRYVEETNIYPDRLGKTIEGAFIMVIICQDYSFSYPGKGFIIQI